MTLRDTINAFTDAMDKMRISYTFKKSLQSNSTYFRLKYKNQINRVYVRISNHERRRDEREHATPWEGAISIEIGYKPWAEYTLDRWFECLDKIADMFPCQETKDAARKITAFERIKRQPMNENLQKILEARRIKSEAIRMDKKRRYEEKLKELNRKAKRYGQETQV